MEVMVMMVVLGAGGDIVEAREKARVLGLSRANGGWMLTLPCALEVERRVHDFGSRCAPEQLWGREGVSYCQGTTTVTTLEAQRESVSAHVQRLLPVFMILTENSFVCRSLQISITLSQDNHTNLIASI